MRNLLNEFSQNIKINLWFIFINVLSLLIAILQKKKNEKIEILTAVLAIGISLSIGMKQLQIENDKMFKELFSQFTCKYDTKYNNELIRITNKSENLTDVEKLFLTDYLNFCSEEYLWYSKNRIDKKVWDSWRNGMLHFLNHPKINQFVLEEKGQENSYYGLFTEIRNDLKNWK